jgi:hypothetical protein
MPTQIEDPLVAEMVALLDDNLREAFEERAGIIEFEAGLQRGHSECLALLSVIDRYPDALSGVTVLLVDVDGVPHHYITTDIDLAREQAAKAGGKEIRATGVAWAIDEEFGSIAELVVTE